jgi:hypothetical protein
MSRIWVFRGNIVRKYWNLNNNKSLKILLWRLGLGDLGSGQGGEIAPPCILSNKTVSARQYGEVVLPTQAPGRVLVL